VVAVDEADLAIRQGEAIDPRVSDKVGRSELREQLRVGESTDGPRQQRPTIQS
jgi:hypothetical protein